MKIKLPAESKELEQKEEVVVEDQDDTDDALPPADEVDETPENDGSEQPEPRNQSFELMQKVANLEGQIEVLKSQKATTGLDSKEEQDLRVKQQCLNDINGLDDESFQQKYRMSKLQANNAIITYDVEKERTTNAQKIAELEVKSDLVTKYPSFNKHFDKVKANVIADLSPEARKDPARLKRAMEREFLAMVKDEPQQQPKKKTEGGDMQRKKIVSDFERPNLEERRRREAEAKDELAPEYKEIGARFGITSESQRKKFMNPYIPMDLGAGIRFEDPKKGFEKKVAGA